MQIRVLHIVTLTCLAATPLIAADSPLVGKWKLNPGKSKMVGTQMKFEDLGGGSYKLTFGDDSEDYLVDGKEHPTRYGSMRTVTPEGANKWKEVNKRDGKVTSTGVMEISDDGKTLTSASDGTRPDGSAAHNTFKAKRVEGTSGFAGTWESTELNLSSPMSWEIMPYKGDGLSFVTPEYKEHDDIKFDGVDVPNQGPRVAPGATTAGKKTGERTVELSDKLKGKLLDVQHLEVSEDGKTLTDTLTFSGMDKTEVDVYDRE